MLVSYADKKSNVKKKTNMVLLLLTIQYEVRVSKDLQAKPQPIVSYDHMKGWVDVVDLISAMASTPVKNKCWAMNECSLLHVWHSAHKLPYSLQQGEQNEKSKLQIQEYIWLHVGAW